MKRRIKLVKNVQSYTAYSVMKAVDELEVGDYILSELTHKKNLSGYVTKKTQEKINEDGERYYIVSTEKGTTELHWPWTPYQLEVERKNLVRDKNAKLWLDGDMPSYAFTDYLEEKGTPDNLLDEFRRDEFKQRWLRGHMISKLVRMRIIN